MATVFSWIEGVESAWHLAFLMNAYPKNSELGKATGAKKDFPHNVFRWNFTPLSEVAKGTIEFRQAPGSYSAATSKVWIQFVASFIQGAILHSGSLDPKTPPTLELFQGFLLAGAQSSGIHNLSPLQNLFVGKSQLPPGAYDLKGCDKDGLMKLKKKALEKNITLAKFKLLYGYK
jgi:hypothetical protein